MAMLAVAILQKIFKNFKNNFPNETFISSTSSILILLDFIEEQNKELLQLMQQAVKLALQEQVGFSSTTIISTMKRLSIEISNDDNNYFDDHLNAEATAQRRPTSSALFTMTLTNNLKRYKSKNIDYFHFNAEKAEKTENITFDVFVFTDRVKKIIALKIARLI